MKKIALIAFILGVLMATLAYVAQLSDWSELAEYMTLGFVGYILIISSTAYYLTSVLYEWSRETETWQG
ncbi:hypothetical protein SAMN05518672_112124 [Chitinophaga sp. CF118]|uniref:hypothetical protein n=1 Tax=Chitinophaga sp. CF118 TaxID=1884367 RepID=UPI0008F291E2|nr:hypothetical protein [Chitinophaga sp. CF118]SFE93589.1 hypothetical protein SAMN05518672_112124 [Chitinophaga sp. CF118]